MPRFTPDFLDELKSRLRPSDVIGGLVKLRKQGNEWAGLSPFTKEKTPSFFVNDHKGFYHCFSSGKHGDVISFLQEVQGLSFLEAVTRLAEQAGLPLPADDPAEARAHQQRKGLIEALEAAAAFYQLCLHRGGGRNALDYLTGRDVGEKEIEAFSLGYAPESRTGLKDHLINKGFEDRILVEAGLAIKPDDGGPSYDRFRHRIMFPIHGTRNEVIAFGGRALDKAARAKYLNSPETPVFHKGGVLYNYNAAREALAKKDGGANAGVPLVVCEGYMDVIALWRAGFHTGVAPLGTALTENQLALLWRASDEPILCFDGDNAGQRAAYRSIDRALPLLKPGKSLQFAFLPAGEDPDDLIRASGADAFRTILQETLPLAETLWRRESSARDLTTPERRAAFKASLRDGVRTIADKDVRDAYGAYLAERLATASRPQHRSTPDRYAGYSGGGAGGDRGGGYGRGPFSQQRGPNQRPNQGFGASMGVVIPVRSRDVKAGLVREKTLVLLALQHPSLIIEEEASFLALTLGDPGLQTVLDSVIAAVFSAEFDETGLDSDKVKSHLQKTQAADAMERLLKDETLNRQSFLRPDAELEEVLRAWRDALRRHHAETDARRDLADAATRLFSDGQEASWMAAVAVKHDLSGPENPDDVDFGESEERVSSRDLQARLDRTRRRFETK